MPLTIDVKHYRPKGAVAKKEHELRQKNEDTNHDNYQEGICLMCESRDLVIGRFVRVCLECILKHRVRWSSIIKPHRAGPRGICEYCGNWSRRIHPKFNILSVNARVCLRCGVKMDEAVFQAGVIPYVHRGERLQGKGWRDYFGFQGFG